jgi:hypothetical protein
MKVKVNSLDSAENCRQISKLAPCPGVREAGERTHITG